MDVSGPRTWLMLSLAAVFGTSVVTAPEAAQAAPAQQVVVDDQGGDPATRVRDWATGIADLAPTDVNVLWEKTVAVSRTVAQACVIPKDFLHALKQITDGTLEPEVRGNDLVTWNKRGKVAPSTARKWIGAAEFRVDRPGKPNESRILIHPAGRIGYTTDHYLKIHEFHPLGGCDCAARNRRRG